MSPRRRPLNAAGILGCGSETAVGLGPLAITDTERALIRVLPFCAVSFGMAASIGSFPASESLAAGGGVDVAGAAVDGAGVAGVCVAGAGVAAAGAAERGLCVATTTSELWPNCGKITGPAMRSATAPITNIRMPYTGIHTQPMRLRRRLSRTSSSSLSPPILRIRAALSGSFNGATGAVIGGVTGGVTGGVAGGAATGSGTFVAVAVACSGSIAGDGVYTGAAGT